MIKSFKEYFAALGKWGFIVAALLIGDILGIIQTYDNLFALPQWGWWLILAVILTVVPFYAFHKLKLKRDELQSQLDIIRNSRPNIVILGTKNIKTPIINLPTREILGEPCFSHALFANNPLNELQAQDAPNVAGHIYVYNESGKCIYNDIMGRWAETKEEALGGQPTEMEQITLAANGRPNPMDIILKYRQDQDCYIHTNAGRRRAPNGWRDKDNQLGVGNYFVRVRLRSNIVDKEFWLKLANNGQGTDVLLETLTSTPTVVETLNLQP